MKGARPALLRELPRLSPALAAATGAGLALEALLPTAFVLASGFLVASVPDAVRDGLSSASGRTLITALFVMGGLFLVQQAVVPLTELATAVLARRLDYSLSDRLARALLAPASITHLEAPETLDLAAQARGLTGFTPGGAVLGIVRLWSSRLAGAGGVVILIRLHWAVALGLAAAGIAQRRFWRQRFDDATQAYYDRGGIHRRCQYLRDLVLTPPAAKEVQVFGLGAWLSDRMHESWDGAMAGVWRQMRGSAKPVFLGCLFPWAVTVAALLVLAQRALAGAVSVGGVVVYAQAVLQAAALGRSGTVDRLISEGAAMVPPLLELERRAGIAPDAGASPPEGAPRQEIRFENVSFQYPDRDEKVFDGLDLCIEAGRSTAIVGVNGAGKTTLVKLLAGLHPPTAGRITVDGVDVASLRTSEWQRRVAAIFQDFQRYEVSARENIGFGAPEHLGDEATVRAAAARVDIDGVLDALPRGWDSPLSRQYTGGADLSGGEWQRVALARALMARAAGATVLVLDEPTAHLGVRAEAALYEQLLDVTREATVVLVSHRFSTVRRADRIVVLEGGRVVEDGSHDELVRLGGRYAGLFQLQANRLLGVDEEDGAEEEEVAS